MYIFLLIRAQHSNPCRHFSHSNDTWQMYFAREIDKRGEPEENPFYEPVEQPVDDDNAKDEDVTMKDAPKEDDKHNDAVEEEIKQENGVKQEEDTKQASDEEQEQKEPVKERRPINYFDMPLELRVHLLHILCEVSIIVLLVGLSYSCGIYLI